MSVNTNGKEVFAQSLLFSLQVWISIVIVLFFASLAYVIAKKIDINICNHGIFYIRMTFSQRDLRLVFSLASAIVDVTTFLFYLTAARFAWYFFHVTSSILGVNDVGQFTFWTSM